MSPMLSPIGAANVLLLAAQQRVLELERQLARQLALAQHEARAAARFRAALTTIADGDVWQPQTAVQMARAALDNACEHRPSLCADSVRKSSAPDDQSGAPREETP